MKWLETLGSILQAVLFILTHVYKIDEEKRKDASELSQEADQAIRDGRFDDVIGIWSRMRNL